jgi:hypothetical protein
MSELALPPLSRDAIVAKASTRPGDFGQYLRLMENGAPTWIDDPRAATRFASMREAMRASLRLPSTLHAFAVPRAVECGVRARAA